MDRVMVFDINGVRYKPFPLPEAKATCKRCGAPIRWAKDPTVPSVRLPLDKDIYIVKPSEGFDPAHRKYLTREGQVITGRPLKRGFAGCKVAFRIHRCQDCTNEERAEVQIIKSNKRGRR